MSREGVELFRKGYVITPRSKHYKRPAKRRSTIPVPPGYTLHRETCGYVRRSTRLMPAPVDPYPGTTACPYCKPSLTVESDENDNS